MVVEQIHQSLELAGYLELHIPIFHLFVDLLSWDNYQLDFIMIVINMKLYTCFRRLNIWVNVL